MPRSHPRRRLFDNQVVDPTDWSDTWTPFAELLGSVDEHNISSATSTTADIEDDFDPACFGVYGTVGFVDNDALAAMYGVNTTAAYAPVTGNRVEGQRQWASIPNTFADFYSEGGKLRIQLRAAFRSGAGLHAGRPYTVKIGIRVDGGLVTESVIGGQDIGSEASNMEQGIGINRHTQSPEVTVPISTGRHSIQGVIWMETMEGVPISNLTAVAVSRIFYANIDYRVMVR